jgi:vacuolar-type H+-ATPase subunit H
MDIIGQILEMDAEAEQRLLAAREQSEKLLDECAQKEQELEKEALDRAEAYRQELEKTSASSTDAQTLKIRTDEKTRIKKLDAVYESEHEKWEDEIVGAIVSQQ